RARGAPGAEGGRCGFSADSCVNIRVSEAAVVTTGRPHQGPSDEELLAGFLGGSRESFDQLVGRWQAPLYHFAYRFLGQHEEARDVCQETFLRVYRRADRFRDGARFSTWLYQIALNLCRDLARRRQRWGRIVVAAENGSRNEVSEAPDRGDGAEESLVK